MGKLLKRFWNWISWLCYQLLYWFRFTILDSRGTYLIIGLVLGATSLNLFNQTEQIKALLTSETKQIIITASASEPMPIVKDDKALANYLADLIYHKESSNGLNDDKCERLGPNSHNGYGFRQGIDRNFCMGSDEEVRELVLIRLQELIDQELTDNEILCVYNTGKVTDSCTYLNI